MKKHIVVAIALVLIVVAIRSPDFFRSAAAADEGLYAVAAREVLRGHLPYVRVWEAKPPLFFAMLALFMRAVGPSMQALRLASTAAACAATLGIYAIGCRFARNGVLLGAFAAVLYACAMASDSGTSAEAEAFYSAFDILALALVFPAILRGEKLGLRLGIGAGLLSGLALEMKVTAAFEVLFVLALVAYASRFALRSVLCSIGAVLLPTAFAFVPYATSGNVGAFLDANLFTVLRRVNGYTPPRPPLLDIARNQIEAFFPVLYMCAMLPAALRRSRERTERTAVLALVLWLVADIAALVAIREFIGYQWLPLMAPLALLASWSLLRVLDGMTALRVAAAVSAVAFVAHATGRFVRLTQPDDEAKIGAYLRDVDPHTGAWLYVADDDPVLYILTDAPVPTRYPYPQHLYAPRMEIAAGVQGAPEIDRIFAHRPSYVVYRGRLADPDTRDERRITVHILRQYREVYRFDDRAVYRIDR